MMPHDPATLRAHHDRFVARVAGTEVVWGLESTDGLASCPSHEDEAREVILFWSDRADAARVKQTQFPEYDPIEVTLFDFLFRWLSGMQRDRVLAGPNWTGDLAGLETDPGDLRDQILTALGPDKAREYAQRLQNALKRQEG
jgi:hypothetical protein